MKRIKLTLFPVLIFISNLVLATPESANPLTITMIRPYVSGGIYIYVDSNELCNTTVFLIDGAAEGKDAIYSAALSAFMANKKVRLEALSSTGCTGWGTKLQSIYLIAG